MVVDGKGQLDQQRCSEDFMETLCLSQFQMGRSSRATSQKVFLNEGILATQATFCIIPCPWGKKFCLVNGRHQPDLFCSFTQEIPSIGLYKEHPMDFELMFDRSKQYNCIIDYFYADCESVDQNLFTNGRHQNFAVVFISQNLFHMGKKCRIISLNSTYIMAKS